MNIIIRESSINDLGVLEEIEKKSFPEFQRSNKRGLRLSLHSPFQEVWIAEKKNKNHPKVVGAITLFKYKRSIRVYSVGVLPEFQKEGVGSYLISHACHLAISRHCDKVILEAHSKNHNLIEWYKKKGFKELETIKDFYKEGEDCIKMSFEISKQESVSENKNIIVYNKPKNWHLENINAKIISVKKYITEEKYQLNNNYRIFNLCSSYQYQSYGYYVSLLASARGQRVIPNTTTIRDFKSIEIIRSISSDIDELLQEALKHKKENSFCINVYFGQSDIHGFKKIASKLYQLFEAPLFKVSFIKDDRWIIKKIIPLNLHKFSQTEFEKVQKFAKEYFDKKRFNKATLKSFKYDLAILTNPNETNPPSCPVALKKFKEAANKKGIYTEFITKDDFDKINEFDALLIRETTSVNNHTYEISRLAYAEGLVVIDDPWSIIRCSNKIYQNELFKHNKILTPKTIIYTKNLFNASMANDVTFPVVIKQPDSAFSLGITKANDKNEMIEKIEELFKKSDMVVCQEFMYSDFDWRIGIIDHTPIFACKYYMTKDHWQIYNWNINDGDPSGDSETIPISDVPQKILDTAVKASSLIGDGLYGVDLKEIEGKVYVIEVNDNPNIDYGIEDYILKDKLYEKIIDSIYNRIEISRNIKRYVSS